MGCQNIIPDTRLVFRGNPISGKLAILKGVAIDPDDPPIFESQAAYLKRHGFFLAGEERRSKESGLAAGDNFYGMRYPGPK